MRMRSQRGYGEPKSGERMIHQEGGCGKNHEIFSYGEGQREGTFIEFKEGDEFFIELKIDTSGLTPEDHERNRLLLEQHRAKGKVGMSTKIHGDDGANNVDATNKELEEEGLISVVRESENIVNTSQLSLNANNEVGDNVSDDKHDDVCMVCRDGGDLLCCDGCPSTYHQSCLDIQRLPDGDWYCVYCHCKFCGRNSKPFNYYTDDSLESVLLTCRSCWRRYHNSCLRVGSDNILNSTYTFACGSKCQELLRRLQMLLGVKHEIGDGFSWTLVCRTDIRPCPSHIIPTNRVECNSKVSAALSIMKESFKQITDDKTGIDIIPSMLENQWSKFPRVNFEGFFTATLEKGDEMVCVASIRIHGNEIAEMPFIATDPFYRIRGMCHRLMNAIESALSYLNVELLFIPSIPVVTQAWISHFGFEPIDSTTEKLMKNKNLVWFPGTDKLQRKIPKLNLSDANLSFIEVFNLLKNNQKHERPNNYDEAGASRWGRQILSVSSREVVTKKRRGEKTARRRTRSSSSGLDHSRNAQEEACPLNMNLGDCEGSSKRAKQGLQVDQTAPGNALSLGGSNAAASGTVDLHHRA